eukprot:scaffold108039_cov76-Phaeocystis_antarctica.AAC.1
MMRQTGSPASAASAPGARRPAARRACTGRPPWPRIGGRCRLARRPARRCRSRGWSCRTPAAMCAVALCLQGPLPERPSALSTCNKNI